jgi:hypothetical protein
MVETLPSAPFHSVREHLLSVIPYDINLADGSARSGSGSVDSPGGGQLDPAILDHLVEVQGGSDSMKDFPELVIWYIVEVPVGTLLEN